MDFGLDDEQRAIVDTVRTFTERELFPHEEQVEQLGEVPPELVARSRNGRSMPVCTPPTCPRTRRRRARRFGVTLVDREFGGACYALHYIVARPSNILRACTGDQIESTCPTDQRRTCRLHGDERARRRQRRPRR